MPRHGNIKGSDARSSNQSNKRNSNSNKKVKNQKKARQVPGEATCVWDSLLSGLNQVAELNHAKSSEPASLWQLPPPGGVKAGNVLLRVLRKRLGMYGNDDAAAASGASAHADGEDEQRAPATADDDDDDADDVPAGARNAEEADSKLTRKQEHQMQHKLRARQKLALVRWKCHEQGARKDKEDELAGVDDDIGNNDSDNDNNHTLTEREQEEMLEALRSISAGPNGYFCSACDPLLACVCAAFAVDIENRFCGRLMSYSHPQASAVICVVSNGGHMQLVDVQRL